jgi:hypothetical protein
VRDIETIDAELRLVAALRRAARERGGPLPSLDVADALLDERFELAALGDDVGQLAVRVDGPANRLQPKLDAFKISRGRQLVSNPHDGRANIGDINVQLAASRQVSSHRAYLVVGQPPPQQCQQRYVVVFGDSVRVSRPNEPHKPGHQIAQLHLPLHNDR